MDLHANQSIHSSPFHEYSANFTSYNSSTLQRTFSFTHKRASGVSHVRYTDNMNPQRRSRTRRYGRYLRTWTASGENTYNEKYSSQTGRSVWFLTDVLYLWCWADDRNSVQNGSLKPFASFGFMFFASMISMFNMIFGAWPTEIRRVMRAIRRYSRSLSTCTRAKRRRTEDSPESVLGPLVSSPSVRSNMYLLRGWCGRGELGWVRLTFTRRAHRTVGFDRKRKNNG